MRTTRTGSPSRTVPSTSQGEASLHSPPREIGVGPNGSARLFPSVQNATVPGSTTWSAPSRARLTGVPK